jgi:hypothetical protein
MDELDCTMPTPSAIDELYGYLDSAHSNCVHTRWYVGVHVFCLAGASIAYRSNSYFKFFHGTGVDWLDQPALILAGQIPSMSIQYVVCV